MFILDVNPITSEVILGKREAFEISLFRNEIRCSFCRTGYQPGSSLNDIDGEVVFPKDASDLKNLVKWVSENKSKYPNLALTPRSAGTCMSGGAIGESIIIDFTRYMNKVDSIESY